MRSPTPRQFLPFVAVGLLLLPAVTQSLRADVTVRFSVYAPDLRPEEALHLTGDIPELGRWNPDGTHMTNAGDGTWIHEVRLPAGTSLEFKITRGTWATEAVGADGLELPNYRLEVRADTTLRITVAAWRDRVAVPPLLSPARMTNKGGVIELSDPWEFAPGDDPARAAPGCDDTGWTTLRPALPAGEDMPAGWSGIGWFRLHVLVDSAWFGRPLALYLRQTGASEIFLNGRIVARIGTPSATAVEERGYSDRYARLVTLGHSTRQVFAVRYSNHEAAQFHRFGRSAGFFLFLTPPEVATINAVEDARNLVAFQTFFTTIALGLALLHLLLFIFDRTERAHFFFSLLMGGIGLSSYLDFHGFITSPTLVLWLLRLNPVLSGITLTAALLTSYAFARRPFPRHVWALIALSPLVLVLSELNVSFAQRYGMATMVGAVSVDVLRVLAGEMTGRRRQEPGPGGWIAGAGATVYIVATLVQLFMNAGLLRLDLPFSPFYLGFLVFGLSMSANLAWQWAATNRALRQKLREVEELSRRSLEQERRAREEELARRLVEADNARKTHELEEARRLQVSMLPRTLPELPGLLLAVSMTTASEVGGDYYDFRTDGPDTLTIALGDATGHGTKAGIMVALMKSLFNTLGHSFHLPDFFAHGTQFIRRMNMEGMYMGLTLVRITPHGITAAAAGMPPLFLFRAATGEVQRLVIKGMPLGAHPGYPYTQVTDVLHPGDTLLLMSDGLAEQFNEELEEFDYPRVEEVIRRSAGDTPEEVVAALTDAAARWRGSREVQDDMTFVVVKRLGFGH
jgi:serine phosphatase RsbU (regulator of sigma subunit)